MEKIWLKNYPLGVPHHIDLGEAQSLLEIFERSFEKFKDKPAYSNLGTTLSYQEIDHLSLYFASFFQSSLKLSKGSCVAVMMPNTLQYPVSIFGILRGGFTVTNVNPLYTPRELKHQLIDSEAETIIILSNFASKLEEVLSETRVKNIIITDLGDMFPLIKSRLVNFTIRSIKRLVPAYSFKTMTTLKRALAIGKRASYKRPEIGQDDLAFLQYTGGTTGGPKGAMLSHGNMVANLLQIRAWLSGHFLSGEEILITPLPLYHIFSLLANALYSTLMGAHSVLITNPRDMKSFVKELGKWKFTFITGVNTLFNGLINQPGFKNIDFSALKISIASGMPVLPVTSGKWLEITGKPLIEAYGMTEASPGICFNPPALTEVVETSGLPLPSTSITVRDQDNREVEIGEAGELWARGPQVMRGYWNNREESDKVLFEGWLKTGDIVVVDHRGYIKLIDRKKDMILVSGFNVYPNEIEEVACRHPDVFEAAAIGVPDDKSGEAVRLFVVKREDSLTEKELLEFLRGNLAGYKRPKEILFKESLPKSNIGKILRRELR